MIQRSEFVTYIQENKDRILEKQQVYRRRQAIVEHPFGTIKRQWGFDYILTKKGRERASADVGLMFTAYNLRRIMNIVGKRAFRDYLTGVLLSFTGSLRAIGVKYALILGQRIRNVDNFHKIRIYIRLNIKHGFPSKLTLLRLGY